MKLPMAVNFSKYQGLVIPHITGKITQQKVQFFSRRVVHYWYKLPAKVQHSTSVNGFKHNLELFKRKNTSSQGDY